jgi:hypothetical protein
MRTRSLVILAVAIFFHSQGGPIKAQQTPNSATAQPQPSTLLAQSMAALTGSVVVSDVTLTGTAEWIAGSDDETGSATYKSTSAANRLDLVLSNGTRSEIRSIQNGLPSGNWISPDGVSHAMANHNVMTDAGWFPAFTLGSLIASSNMVLTYVGPETRNGASVIHINASQQFPNISGDSVSLMQHLTQVDLYLDPATLLPVAYVFNSHADDNALLDIPTEIRYSDYQTFGGAHIPLHVQKFISNTLAIDLQFQNASLNTGITAAQISAQ